jgi:uncharacterized protein YxjI
MSKSYFIHQRIQPLVNQYEVYEGDAAGNQGRMVAFAQQKRLAFKEKFNVYTDESKSQTAFELEARQVIDLGARYDVRDPQGNILGTIGKDFKSSLLRSTWHIFRPGEENAPAIIVQERSQNLAIARRIWGFLPYIGEIPFFLKYHFDFIDPTSQNVVATYNKTTTMRDHYQLTIENESAVNIDWRVLVSLGIMMDAMQSR